MSDTVLKRLNVSDVFTIPYEANKLWSVTSSNFEDYGIIIEEKDSNKIEEILKSYTDLQIVDKQLKIKEIYNEYYTYEGAFNKIKNIICK